jgi:hypothetical protein
MSWSTYDGWENGSWGIVSGESGFAHTGTVVNNESCNIIISHFLFE